MKLETLGIYIYIYATTRAGLGSFGAGRGFSM